MPIWDKLFGRSGPAVKSIDWLETPAELKAHFDAAVAKNTRISLQVGEHFMQFRSLFVAVNHPSDVGSGGSIIIDVLMPAVGNEYITEPGIHLRAFYMVQGAGRFTFPTEFRRRLDYDGYPGIEIAYPGKIRVDERRKLFRIEPAIDTPLEVEVQSYGPGEVMEISAGGMKFSSDHTFHPGQIVNLAIAFPNEHDQLKIDFSIIECRVDSTARGGKINVVRGEFVSPRPGDMDRVTRYVMYRQRQILRKEQWLD